eukprot:jgi/Tetstr1/464348/TSEL_009143.t1
MHGKAILFRDYETAAKIMAADRPGRCKALGRQVANFDEAKWKRHRMELVMALVSCKFTQLPDLRAAQLETTGSTLVEASSWDRIWGIGMNATEAGKMLPARWKGQNLLGRSLTELRERIMAGDIPASGLTQKLPPAEASPPARWKGRNLLGRSLTELRERIMAGDIPASGLTQKLPPAEASTGVKQGTSRGGGSAAGAQPVGKRGKPLRKVGKLRQAWKKQKRSAAV